MSTFRPPPSPNPTDRRPVCRICFGNDESGYCLIRPCRCRGSIALVHPNCLTTWVKTSGNTVCRTCTTEFTIEPEEELKNFRDWSKPRPLSTSGSDVEDFYLAIVWMLYLGYLCYVYMSTDVYEMRLWMDGHIKLMYTLMLIVNLIPTCGCSMILANYWRVDNSVYKFVDHSTKTERKKLDTIQVYPFSCALCPDDVEKVSPLIWLCGCRRHNYPLHNDCVVAVAEQMKAEHGWNDLSCGHCYRNYEKEPIRLKTISEWSWPRPLSNTGITRQNVFDALFYYFYATCTIYLLIMTNGDEIGNSIFDLAAFVCWLQFWMNMFYYCRVVFLVSKKWFKENCIYKFKERVLTERKVMTETKTARCTKTEMKTARCTITEMKTARCS